MTAVALAYDASLDAYGFGSSHPLRPERVALSVALMGAYGLASPSHLEPIAIGPAGREDLERVHHADYIDAVIGCSRDGAPAPGFGIGPGDTPAFVGMHDASARIAGATSAAVVSVCDGRYRRALSPAGGLHHAHRERAAGFCVYNDVAVGIAAALAKDPTLRVAYIDIDAHHGDGVQEAFYEEPRVLTISLHEDGRYLYPGTGSYRERGSEPAPGSALNVPMPPYATDECYALALQKAVLPAVRAFGPDIIVTQNGADAHWSDPLTSLGRTVPGYESTLTTLVALADENCGGRIVACGGGGYSWLTVVPRIWTLLAGSLLDVEVPELLPTEWTEQVRALGGSVPGSLRDDDGPALDDATRALVLHDTRHVLDRIAEF